MKIPHILFGVAALVGPGAVTQAATLNVTVQNVRPGQGQIVVCLWRDASGFPDCDKHQPAQTKKLPADGATLTVSFGDLAEGTYAVGVAQDLNGNGRVDTNFLGIPKEPVSVSNDAKRTLGAPKFKDASFVLSGEKKIVVRM